MRGNSRWSPGFRATVFAVAVLLGTALFLEVARADTVLICDREVTVHLTHPIEPAKVCIENTCLDMQWVQSVFNNNEVMHSYARPPFSFAFRMERGDTKKATFAVAEDGQAPRVIKGSCVLENTLGS